MLQKQKQHPIFCLPLEKFRSGRKCQIKTTLHMGLLLPREGRIGRCQEKTENERFSCSKDSAKMMKFPHGACAKFDLEFEVSLRTISRLWTQTNEQLCSGIALRPAMDTNKRTAVFRYGPGSRHPFVVVV